jgi:hypothetical protein
MRVHTSTKLVYGDEWSRWVGVRNQSNRWGRAEGPCAWCGEFKMGVVWVCLESGEVRCRKCFDPKPLRDLRIDENGKPQLV